MFACRATPYAILFGLMAVPASAYPAGAEPHEGLTAVGTEFVLTAGSGRVLRGADLAGATLSIASGGKQVEVTINSVEEDRGARGGQILLYHLTTRGADGRTAELCTPDADGRRLGFPVPDSHGGFALTCTSGAVGKCIRWGYRPWDEQPGGPPLAALHQACVHMARADYGGDGRATTREGMLVYWCDRFGVHPCGEDVPIPFEAAWGQDGAICVAHSRIPGNVSLQDLAQHYPRLKSHLGPTACSEESAMPDPAALLFNRS